MTSLPFPARLWKMSDATPEELDRMMLSRATLARYQRAGADARIDRRMVDEEIAILRGFIAKYPAKADTLGLVIEGWEGLG